MTAAENPLAFPCASETDYQAGMTLRDWFAGQALPAVITACAGDTDARKVGTEAYFAMRAYGVADAMLAERAK